MRAVSAQTPDGEFRVPEDVEAEDAERAALLTGEPDPAATDAADDDAAEPADAADHPDRAPRRRLLRRPATGEAREPVDLSEVDLSRTPGPVVGAVALGVVAAPLLGVYAVLFVTRYFLKPGVTPDVTSSWTGEGIAGVVAAVLALAMLVIVARAAGGRGLPVFVGSQVAVVAACAYLLSDDASGGRGVTVVVLVVALAALVCALVPTSRRWFAAHAADRALDA